MSNPFAKYVDPSAAPMAQQQDQQNPFAKYVTPQVSAVKPNEDAAPKEPQLDWSEYLTGIARSVAQGVTFNWADEIEAIARTMFGGDREMAQAKIRDEIEKFQKRHPYLSTGAEIAGAIAVPGATGLRAVRAVGGLRGWGGGAARVAAGATAGAAGGAVSGMGATKDKDDLPGAAIAGAIPGVLLGGAIPVAAQGVKTAWRGASSHLPDWVPGATATRNRVAGESIDEAITRDAMLSGRTRDQQYDEILRTVQQDAQAPRGTGTASIFTSARNDDVYRTGESVEELLKDAGARSTEAQSVIRAYQRQLHGALPSDAYDAFYARGAVPHGLGSNTAIRRLLTRDYIGIGAEHQARRRYAIDGTPPPNGTYDARLLHLIDQELRAASERASRNDRNGAFGRQIGRYRDQFGQLVDSIYPQLPGVPTMRTIQAQSAANFGRIAQTSDVVSEGAGTQAQARAILDELVRSGIGAGVGSNFHSISNFVRAITRWARGDIDRGVAITRLLTQRVGAAGSNQEREMNRLIERLRRMPEDRRNNYLDAAIAASSQQVGKISE